MEDTRAQSNNPPSPPISSTKKNVISTFIVKTLAIARTLVGVSLLAVPTLTSRTFFLPVSASSALVLRLGGLLWSASSATSQSAEPVRTALVTGAVVDAMDLVSVGACLLDGSVATVPAAAVGGGAAVFLAAGLRGLRAATRGNGGEQVGM